ncbi:hypothetical protein [Ramlibacter alkalitolerans]|uniref:TMhelix containing protein n=1 Tax=Ramlibacter alkalitolerans TaxID=2039631 RepID=A0ABS1JTZ3_9BURK|nr:hypothetical protein [Ramlibacter alkalitolerans]MBL0427748.1 hypothetical protein [Ramlibacter alkalitolerans]
MFVNILTAVALATVLTLGLVTLYYEDLDAKGACLVLGVMSAILGVLYVSGALTALLPA